MALWFVAGIVVGWLIELVIDWSFWRRRTTSVAPTNLATLNELASLRRKVKDYEARLLTLDADSDLSSDPQSSVTNSSSSISG